MGGLLSIFAFGEGGFGGRQTVRFLSVQFQGGLAGVDKAGNVCDGGVKFNLEWGWAWSSGFRQLDRLWAIFSLFFSSHMFKIYYHRSIRITFSKNYS